MKTITYNPSKIEVDFANVLEGLSKEIEAKLPDNRVVAIDNNINKDNPALIFHLEDTDGDPHEIVLKIIQKPDSF